MQGYLLRAKKTNDQVNLDSRMMVPEGVEPSTLALLAPHSNQLSYGTRLIVFVE
jgi:hypothetical protein